MKITRYPWTNEIKTLVVDRKGQLKELFENSSKEVIETAIETEENALDTLDEQEIHCVVYEVCSSIDGNLELLKKFKREHPDIPFIIYAVDGNEEIAADAISEGADDYVFREDYEILKKRIKRLVEANRSEKSAEKILRRMDDGFFAVDKNWMIEYVNEEGSKIMGRSKNQLVGEKLWEVFPSAEESRFELKYRKAFEKQESTYFEEYYGPLETWFSVKVYPSSSGLSIYFSDISDRKQWKNQVKDQLRYEEVMTNLLRKAIEEEDIVDFQHTALKKTVNNLGIDYGRILKLDKEADQLIMSASYGYRGVKIGRPEIKKNGFYQASEAISSREPVAVEDFVGSDLERSELLKVHNVRSGLSVVIGEYNDPWGVLAVHSEGINSYTQNEIKFVQNIANIIASAIHSYKQQLKLEEYKKALNGVNYGILVIDDESEVKMANKAFEEISGYRSEQLKGTKNNLIKEEPVEDKKIITELERKDGKLVPVQIRFNPVELSDGSKGKVAIVSEQSN